MSSDGSVLWDAAEEVENNTERTPRDEARDGPVRPQELLPRGPPPPEPVCWSAASGSAAQSRGAMGDSGPSRADHAAGSDTDSEPARRWPVLRENGTDLRVQGPHLPRGRFERTPATLLLTTETTTALRMPPLPATSGWTTTELMLSQRRGPKPALPWLDHAWTRPSSSSWTLSWSCLKLPVAIRSQAASRGAL